MPFVGPLNAEEWLASPNLFSGGAHVNAAGFVGLAPDDLTPNRFWAELEDDGTPHGWVVGMPPERRGFHAYVTEAGGTKRTLSRQTLAPMPYLGAQAWVANQAFIRETHPTGAGIAPRCPSFPSPASPW